jgi:hypothetical protein
MDFMAYISRYDPSEVTDRSDAEKIFLLDDLKLKLVESPVADVEE